LEDFRLFDLLHKLKHMPLKEDALAAKENGVWRKYSTQEYIDTVNFLSYAFLRLGTKNGDKIGLIANNRPEWNFVDYACLQTANITVPLYPTISDHDLKHVIKDAGIKYFFVANEALYNKVKACSEGSSIIEIFCFDAINGIRSLNDLIKIGKEHVNTQMLEDICRTGEAFLDESTHSPKRNSPAIASRDTNQRTHQKESASQSCHDSRHCRDQPATLLSTHRKQNTKWQNDQYHILFH
jgi:long-subunit acyl-CoA synthetase (AMP-forming)